MKIRFSSLLLAIWICVAAFVIVHSASKPAVATKMPTDAEIIHGRQEIRDAQTEKVWKEALSKIPPEKWREMEQKAWPTRAK